MILQKRNGERNARHTTNHVRDVLPSRIQTIIISLCQDLMRLQTGNSRDIGTSWEWNRPGESAA